jgi:hypothetical protein
VKLVYQRYALRLRNRWDFWEAQYQPQELAPRVGKGWQEATHTCCKTQRRRDILPDVTEFPQLSLTLCLCRRLPRLFTRPACFHIDHAKTRFMLA